MATRNRVIFNNFSNINIYLFFHRLETWLTKYDNEMRQKQVDILFDKNI